MGAPIFPSVRRVVFLLAAAFTALGGGIAPLWGQPTLISQPIPTLNLATGATAQAVNLTNYIRNPNATGTVVRIAVGTLSSNANTISPSSMVLIGNIDIALTDNLTPQTVANFLAYIKAGDFVDNIIHRSMPGFVIQGGGFNFSVVNGAAQAGLVPTMAPVPFEQGLSNVAGTIAMAQSSGNQNSATSQWFINLVDNSSNLDSQDGGFCAFGTVLGNGMTVANAIAALPADDLTGFAASLSSNATVQANIAGAWTNVPLANLGANLSLANFVFTNISQIPALTFTASSGNTSLVTASVSGNTLMLTPVASATGSTTITITATDTEGAAFQTTFTVNIAPPGVWTGATNGNWGASTNWASGVVPNSSTSVANFTNTVGQSSTITLNGTISVGEIAFNATNSAGFTIDGSTLDLFGSVSSPFTAIADNSSNKETIASNIAIEGAQQWLQSASTGNLVISGAVDLGNQTLTINTTNSTILNGLISDAGSFTKTGVGTLTLSNASNDYTGNMTVSSGTLAIASGEIAQSIGSSANIIVTGASSSLSGTFVVGDAGSANLTISNGGTFVTSGVYLGNSTGGSGNIVVTGENSKLIDSLQGYSFWISVNGSGSFSVLDGATATSSYGISTGGTSLSPGAMATVTVDGQNSLYTGSVVMNYGTVTVSNGGQIHGDGTIGGSALITGPGSVWMANLNSPYKPGPFYATGCVTVANGGLLEVSNETYASVTGSLTATGVNSSVTGNIVMGNAAAQFDILNGANFAGNAGLNDFVPSGVNNGTIIVSGAGSTWNSPGGTEIDTNETVIISNGGSVNMDVNYNAALPYDTTITGTAVVTGAGSSWSANSLILGYGGAGSLSILNGGMVSGSGNIGIQQFTSGNVLVDGSGSEWNGPTIILGYAGQGHLTVSNGGSVVSSNLIIGSGSNFGTGTVTQTGGTINAGQDLFLGEIGSVYDLIGGTLQIGGASGITAGTLNGVSNYTFTLAGGTVQVFGSDLTTSINATLGDNTTSTLDTNGMNATWSGALSGNGNLAKVGVGILTLAGNNNYTGNTMVTAGTLAVTGSLANGNNLTVNAKTTLLVGAMGTVSQGNISLGGTTSLTVNSLAQHSQITVTSLLNYGGNLTLSLGNALSPGIYSLFASSSSAGDFLNVALTGLFSGELSDHGGVWSGNVSSGTFSFNDTTGSLSVSNNNAPTFTTQPTSITVTAGQAASFTVAASAISGLLTPTYQWQREAAGTSTFVNLTNGGSYSGVSTATLSVSNTTVTMSGDQFQCVATNSGGNATSNPVTLTVNKAAATVTLSSLTQNYTGTARPVTVTTSPAGLSVNVTYNGSTTAPTVPGSYAVVATVTDPNHTGSATGTLVINKSTATVTLSNFSQTYNGTAETVTVTTNPAGLEYSVTYNGSTTPPVNGGSYVVVATITDPFSSGSTTGTLTIAKAAQTITFAALATQEVGNSPFALTAAASSGLAVTYTSSNVTVATISGNTVTIVGKGTTTITVSQPGNTNYNAAANVTQALTVNQIPAFTTQPANKTATAGQMATFAVAASGLPTPTYQWQREAAGTSTFVNLANSGSYSGVTTATLSVSNTTVTMSGDQFQCVATNSAGSATSNPATLTVNKAAATVTLSNLTQTYTGTPRAVTAATNPSGLACNLTYNGSATAPTIPGSYAVVATVTDANHAGSATGTLVINKSTATVTLSNLSQAYNGTVKSATVVTNPVGLATSVTYNGSTTPPVNGGSYAVVATVTDPFSSGSTTGTLTIAKAAQTITFAALATQEVGNSPFALTAAASSGLAVTYSSSNVTVATISGNTVTIVGKGTATITASQPGNANYNAAANVSQTLTVNQIPMFTTSPANKTSTAGQTATFAVAASGLPTPTYQWQREAVGTSTFVNLANGGSYSGVTTATLSVSNTTVAMAGDQFQCVATNSAGNATSNPATLTVNKALATVTLSNLTQTYTGTPRTVTAATNPSGLACNLTYNGLATAPTVPGSYTVVATVTDANHTGSATGTLLINKSTATVTLSNLSQTYNGSPKAVTVATNPVGLAVSVTYNGSATLPVNGGSYAVVATITDPNSAGSKTGTLTIAKAAQTIAFGALTAQKVGNAPFALTATASSGLPVAYASSNAAVATVSNGMVTIVGKGTATITASQPGNANYNAAANVAQTLTVNQVPVFTTQPVNKTMTSGQTASFTVAATGLPTPSYQWQRMAAGTSTFVNLANSGSYSGVTTPTLSVSGATVAMSGDQFQCVATNVAGSATSNPATLTVGKAPATVTLSNLTQTYTGAALAAKVATNPSGLAFNLTYNGSTTAPVAAGNYTVVAMITDANHSGSATGTLVINKATATMTFSNLSQTYDGTAKSVTMTTNPIGLSVNVTYNGSTTLPVNAGSYPVVATVVDPNYTGTAKGTLTIAKAAQTISFGALSTQEVGNSPFAPGATASSGLAVTYASSNAAVATVSGSMVIIVGKGTAKITASQAGNANYNAAASVTQTLTVNAAVATPALASSKKVLITGNSTTTDSVALSQISSPASSNSTTDNSPTITSSIVTDVGSAAWVSGIDPSNTDTEPSPTVADLPSLLHQAMNLAASSPDSLLPAAAVEAVDGAQYLTLQYRQSKDLGRLSLAVQYSTDDVNWTAVPAGDLTELPDDDVDAERWSARVAIPNSGPVFVRLMATPSQ